MKHGPAIVPGVCASGKTLAPIQPGCGITRLPPLVWDHHARRIVRYAIPWTETWHPEYHQNCVHNQLIGIANRVCGRVPDPTVDVRMVYQPYARRLRRALGGVTSLTRPEFISRYSGSKRRLYERAMDSLTKTPLTSKDMESDAFVKCEAFNPEADYQGKENPDPRIIQARNPRYVIELGRHLRPIEHKLWRQNIRDRPNMTGRIFGKGLSLIQRAKLVVKKFNSIKNCAVVGIDVSRFDRSVSLGHLLAEHDFYMMCNNDGVLAELLPTQLYNRCRTRLGIRYKTKGKRLSGDVNTALGNCVLMYFACSYALRFEPIYDILIDGDDTLVFIPEARLAEVQLSLTQSMAELGHVIRVDSVATEIPEILWCRTRPVRTDLGWNLVRDPRAVIARSLSGIRFKTSFRRVCVLMDAIGQGLLALNRGVPILQAYAMALIRNARKHAADIPRRKRGVETRNSRRRKAMNRALFPHDSLMYWYDMHCRVHGTRLNEFAPVGDTARVTMYHAWGIDPSTQCDLERKFASWDVCFDQPTPVHTHQPAPASDWIFNKSVVEVY